VPQLITTYQTMLTRLVILLLFISFTSKAITQPSLPQSDSVTKIYDGLVSILNEQVGLLKAELAKTNACKKFELCTNPQWAGKNITAESYLKSCKWTSTYIVLNSDSTYLYMQNAEGNINFLQKGSWCFTNDSIVILKNNTQQTKQFIAKMKRLEKSRYQPSPATIKQYKRQKDMLLEKL